MADTDFDFGYLIATANILHLHDNPVIAADVLGELNLNRNILKRFDLSDYDRQSLNKAFDELERRP